MNLDGFDNCLIGSTDQGILVYSKELIVIEVMNKSNLNYIDSYEYCDYNIFQAYVGEQTPIFINEIE